MDLLYLLKKNERILQTSGKITKVYMLENCYRCKLRVPEITSVEVNNDEGAPKSRFNHAQWVVFQLKVLLIFLYTFLW